MRISKLKIQGFRTINRNFNCNLNELSIFVGRNNAGKSCAVRALDLFFNSSNNVDAFIPHIRVNPNAEKKTRYSIIIGVWLKDVPTALKLKYRKFMNGDRELPIRLYYSPKEHLIEYSCFKAGKFSTTKNAGEIKKNIIEDISHHISLKVIPETRDLEREFRTELGQGFQTFKDAILSAAEGKAAKKVKDYKEFLETLVYKELVSKINSNLGEIIPEHEISIGSIEQGIFSRMVLSSLIDDLPISAISNDSDNISIDQMGAGFQSAVLVALYRTVAQLEDKHLILCVEEPEIHLDSHSQRYCYHHWMDQANAENDLNQVLITSHSAFLIDEATPDQVVLIRRDNNGCSVTSQLSDTFLKDIDLDKLSTKTLGLSNTDLFFSSFVVLVEGDGDMVAFRGYLDMLLKHKRCTYQSLALAGISVIDCGGKDGIRALARFLKALGVPFAAVFDRDVIQKTKPKSERPKISQNIIEKTYESEISDDFKNQRLFFKSDAELKRVQISIEQSLRAGLQKGFPLAINNILNPFSLFMMRTEHETDIIDSNNLEIIADLFSYNLDEYESEQKSEARVINELKALNNKEIKKAFVTAKILKRTPTWKQVPRVYSSMCLALFNKIKNSGVRL